MPTYAVLAQAQDAWSASSIIYIPTWRPRRFCITLWLVLEALQRL